MVRFYRWLPARAIVSPSVSGLRTPFARQATAFHGIPVVDLGKMVVGELLARSEIPAEVIEQLVFGQVVQMPEAPNIAREIVLGTGMNVHTDAYSVPAALALPVSRRLQTSQKA